jgi:hypothetical protein
MDRYAARRRILASLGERASLALIAEQVGVTDARLLWHLRKMRRDNLVTTTDEVWWARTPRGTRALAAHHQRAAGRAFPQRIVDDFEDALMEADDGLYGSAVVQASGEHRGRLSPEQAAEFRDRLVSLIEEYFAPGQGDRTGIKQGFHWVLTPIDLHPLDEDEPRTLATEP